LPVVFAGLASIAFVSFSVVQILPGHEHQTSPFAFLSSICALGYFERCLGPEIEVFVFFDVSAVEIRDSLGRAEGDVHEKRSGSFFADFRDKLAKFSGNIRVFRENLFEVRVRPTVGLHHVEDHLVHAEAPQEAVNVQQVRQVAIGEHGRGVQFDAKTFELRDGLQACDCLFVTVGSARQTFVQFFRMPMNRHVKAIHSGFGETRGVGQMRQTPPVRHDADLLVPKRFGHPHEIRQFRARRGFARGKTNFGSSAALFENPADALDRHGRVVHIAAVAIFLHAEDAIVVADRADRDVDAFVPSVETFSNGGLDGRGTVVHAGLDRMVLHLLKIVNVDLQISRRSAELASAEANHLRGEAKNPPQIPEETSVARGVLGALSPFGF